MAQLHLRENNLYAASHCLEVALSFNFEVSYNVRFIFIFTKFLKIISLLGKNAVLYLLNIAFIYFIILRMLIFLFIS